MNLFKTKVVVSEIGQINVRPSSKKDLCGICGRRTMANAVLCKSCGNGIHKGSTKIKRVTNRHTCILDVGNARASRERRKSEGNVAW